MKKRIDDLMKRVDGDSGDDDIKGDSGDDHIHGGAGHDVLDGNSGDDDLDGGSGDDHLNGGRGDDSLLGGLGDDSLVGGSGNDRLSGGSGRDNLVGDAGDDRLTGGSGLDHLAGGIGNDTYVIDRVDEISRSVGDSGIDRVLSSVSYGLGAQQERLVLTGTDDLKGVGNAGDNTVSGNGGDNHLNGGAGDDRLFGEAGDDFLNGGAGDDDLKGGDGHDDLIGAAGDDRLHYDADDSLYHGGAGEDTLVIDGSEINLDLTAIADTVIRSIEEIDLTGSGNNSVTLNLSDVLALSPTTNTLLLTGNAGDSVNSTGQGWVLQVGETETEHGHSYDTYTSGLGTLLVDQTMTVNIS